MEENGQIPKLPVIHVVNFAVALRSHMQDKYNFSLHIFLCVFETNFQISFILVYDITRDSIKQVILEKGGVTLLTGMTDPVCTPN